HQTELHEIEESGTALKLGASVSYSEATAALVKRYPQMEQFWSRIGGEQVRNMGTIGGNIANGSPIGDTPPPLMVLGATVTLRKGATLREVRLEDYFIAYGKQDRQPGEFVESVSIPALPKGEQFAVYKITKRSDEDISALCGAFRVSISDNGVVETARIAFGGMAATPKRAGAVEEALIGKPWTFETIEAAVAAFPVDYQPITDMRASTEYRMLAAQNLLRRFHLETIGVDERLQRVVA
ncbi:MAG: FAD-binding molybdopterin dehydrogenase, partial [Hyphomicrobiales bacterium]|nr:FAD-binding molybdopterin dehydrogenase [Hyphomicrobiales bacterium]